MDRSIKAISVGAAVGFLGVVVAATAGHPGEATTSAFLSTATYRELAYSFGRLFSVALIAYVLYGLVTLSNVEAARGGGGRRLSPLATLALLILVVAGVAVVLSQEDLLRRLGGNGEFGAEPMPEGLPFDGDGSTRGDDLPAPGWVLWATAAAGLVASAVLVFLARRQRPEAPMVQEAPDASIGGPAEDESEPLPPGSVGRVVGAYRRVEARAGAVGIGRGPGETIRTHLYRVGDHADVGDALALGRIYERARYSADVVDNRSAEAAEEAASRLVGSLG